MENVELLDRGGNQYAYVTFYSDRDAYNAFSSGLCVENEIIIARIAPASTWKQPSAIESSLSGATLNSDQPSLLILNDECLLKIFEYCDFSMHMLLWRMNRRMRKLLEEFVLPKVNKYKIFFHEGVPKMPLKRVREELQCIGPYVKELRISNWGYCDEVNKNFVENLERFLHQCKKYVGTSLRELRVDKMLLEIFSGKNLQLIQPFLLKIESLDIYVHSDTDYEENVDIQLPKLKELTLGTYEGSYSINVKFLTSSCPNLERASICVGYENMDEFLGNHGHLKYLHFDHLDDARSAVQAIAKESKNLEELVMECAVFGDEEYYALRPLEKNLKLTKLVLFSIRGEEMKSQMMSLRYLKQLRTLAVTTTAHSRFSADPAPFVDLGRHIPHLEHFCSVLDWNQSTIVEFINNARHLKTFCTGWCAPGFEITMDFIKAVVAARKSIFEHHPDEIIALELIIISNRHRPLSIENVSGPIYFVCHINCHLFIYAPNSGWSLYSH